MTGAIDGNPSAEDPGGSGAPGAGANSGSPTSGNGNGTGGSTGNAGSSNGIPQGGKSATAGSGSNTQQGGNGNAGAQSSGSSGSANLGGSTGSAGAAGGPSGPPPDCKRGVGWHGNSLTNAEVTSKLTWWYTWGLGVQNVGAGFEFAPMVWGGGASQNDIVKALRPDAKYLLGFNEPNFFAQANLSAQQAAQNWPALQGAAQAKGLATVSPAVNYCGDDKTGTGDCHDTNPASYLSDFFAACQGCQVDYVAVHWYNCDGKSLNSYLDMFKQFNRPIWLTEFACAYGGDTSVAGQEKYMREAIPILEARSDVYRYAWFSGDPLPNARLLNADGSPTALGQIYLDLPHNAGCQP